MKKKRKKKREIDPEKLRDMIRSILPSRHRKQARIEKALRKRAHRHGVRADVRLRDAEETSVDLARDVYVKDIVEDRRSDKLNHFMRWCDVLTAGMSKKEALEYVRAILPSDVIGNHAYFHWELHLRYRRNPYRRFIVSWMSREEKIERLRNAMHLDPTLQARFNREIKTRKHPEEPRRMLLGLHDVEAFIDDISRGSPYWLEHDTIERMIEEIEKGGREAALRVLGYSSNVLARMRVSPKYQVVIPKEIRERHGLKPGQEMQVISKGDGITLIPDRPLSAFRGILRGMPTTGYREKKDRRL